MELIERKAKGEEVVVEREGLSKDEQVGVDDLAHRVQRRRGDRMSFLSPPRLRVTT
ncbi:MAG: hypothetical protein M3O70_00365 [Actinomycetota bacterium]|nr:hypothetical protein [Actinomycetota bacterium]